MAPSATIMAMPTIRVTHWKGSSEPKASPMEVPTLLLAKPGTTMKRAMTPSTTLRISVEGPISLLVN